MKEKNLKKKQPILKSPSKTSIKKQNNHVQQQRSFSSQSSKKSKQNLKLNDKKSNHANKSKKLQHQQLHQQQDDDDDLYKEPVKRIIIPDNQLSLTETELNADVSRILTGDDPNVPKNVCTFSYKERCYKLEPPGLSDHMAVHLVFDGCSLHIESKEYKAQKEMEERKWEIEEERRKSIERKDNASKGDQQGENGSKSSNEKLISMKVTESASLADKSKNQFNFSDRATQTLNNKLRSRFVCTEPPPVAQYNENVSQWQIYDSYVNELMVMNMERPDQQSHLIHTQNDELEDDSIGREKMSSALKIVERVVNQNAQDEIYHDFKYWEDASDQFRKGEGSFLPLWRFAYERTKRKQVTALCWNPGSPDMFAVGYGSFDFLQQGSGMICCYTLKNTSYPEYIYSTDSGVLSLDFHSQHPSLLAVGCYDGNVVVFDVSKKIAQPLYSSSVLTGHHSDPVWQVNWQEEEIGKNLNFYSISSDGAVVNWSLSKNNLEMEPVIQLKLDVSLKDDQEETSTFTGLAGGCCFDFSGKQNHLFLVGTEEGNIHKCSKSYSGQYLQTYEGHHMAVYAVKWNPFHEDIFISCSADWTIKVSMKSALFLPNC